MLRVLNDDQVIPRNGFGTHPHRDMEIVTYVVDGEISHKHVDTIGGGAKETLGRGAVQYMSAGLGVRHSEMNDNDTEMCRFLQLWILPDRTGHKPNYGSKQYAPELRKNKALRVVGGQKDVTEFTTNSDGAIAIHQDAQIFVGEIEPGKSVDFPLAPGRAAYLVCIEGSIAAACDGTAETVDLEQRDALEAIGPAPLVLRAKAPGERRGAAHFLVVEMPWQSSQSSS